MVEKEETVKEAPPAKAKGSVTAPPDKGPPKALARSGSSKVPGAANVQAFLHSMATDFGIEETEDTLGDEVAAMMGLKDEYDEKMKESGEPRVAQKVR